MFGLSFLTTLNIYKDYFEGRKRLQKLHKSTIPQCEERCDQKPSFALVLLSLEEAALFCTPLGFVTNQLHDLHRVMK